MSERLRALGIAPALRGVAGPGRLTAEEPELWALIRDWPRGPRAFVALACLGQDLEAGAAREILGAAAYEALLAAGVMVERAGVVRWPAHALYATPYGWLLGDRPLGFAGVVPAPARAFADDESVALAECVARAAPVRSALDVGCGAGLTTLAATRSAAWVVAIDLQPEAVAAARMTVALGELGERVDVRVGDLVQPIAPHERFDRLIAALPALPLPEGAPAPAHAGGRGGAALSAALVEAAPRLLHEGGEAWLGASVLLAAGRVLPGPLTAALAASGAEVSWSRGRPIAADDAVEALALMLAAGDEARVEGWRAAVAAELRRAGADAFAPALFRARWGGALRKLSRSEEDPVQWLR